MIKKYNHLIKKTLCYGISKEIIHQSETINKHTILKNINDD